MRENMGLYRGKRKDNGEWVEGYLLRPNPEVCRASEVNDCVIGYQVSFTEGYRFYEVDPETVGQDTGMTDIGGKRIFEGDIMETAVTGITHHTGAVLYQDGAFGLRCTDESASAFFLCFVAGYYTVIGNIHDTPVLKKEDAQ